MAGPPQNPGAGVERTRPTDICLCHSRALRRAARRVQQLYEDTLKPTGLRQVEFSMLAEIDRRGAVGLGDLAENVLMDRSILRYKLEPLAKAGLVAFLVDERDRRGRRVTLTNHGRATLASAWRLWQAAQDRFEAAFGRDEAEGLRASLNAVAVSTLSTADRGAPIS